MTTVYRVEYPDTHVGPYNDASTEERAMLASSLGLAHSPWNDHGAVTHRVPPGFVGQRSAFRSMRDLFAWFGGWLPILRAYGATVAKYDVPESSITYDDSRQIVFTP